MKCYPEIIQAIRDSIQLADKFGTGKPYLFANGRNYTLEEILQEMEDNTPFGLQTQQSLFNLTIDLLLRGKEKLDERQIQK